MSTELRLVADLMCVAARTAPKTAGQDFVVTAVLEGEPCRELGEAMIRFGEESGKPNFDRDGKNVLASPLVVLIGIKDARPLGINCGACGSEECIKPNTLKAEFQGPQCAFRLLDMGIALGSAVKTAGMLNVDNRIMYRVGAIARRIGMIDADYVMGIPLSVTGKSIYFDRKP
jgi:uncharacterized ferredoxin-like protein